MTVSITDTGIGIAASDLPRLAQPFEQVENVLTRARTGSGLGLAITKTLVELHGGRFDIASRLGEGTIVTVRFPRPPQSRTATRAARSSRRSMCVSPRVWGGKRQRRVRGSSSSAR